jgi:hypothetical protein
MLQKSTRLFAGSSLAAATILTLLGFSEGYVIKPRGAVDNATSAVVPELFRRADDPTSFAWVHRLAAIGDSFTAGIGSGIQLGEVHHKYDDWICSRYDQSYPMLVNNVIGPSVDDFQVILEMLSL